jgi:hypothetical protein
MCIHSGQFIIGLAVKLKWKHVVLKRKRKERDRWKLKGNKWCVCVLVFSLVFYTIGPASSSGRCLIFSPDVICGHFWNFSARKLEDFSLR